MRERWSYKRIKDIGEINNGSDYKSFQSEEGYPVIGSGGQFACATDYLYDGEAVLLGRKGTIDKPLYVNCKFWVVDTMFYLVSNKKNVSTKYLYYSALTIPFLFYSTSTALPSMTQRDLLHHIIYFPPLPAQIAIADYLDKKSEWIASQIALLEKKRDAYSRLKKSLIHKVVTKGLNPNVEFKDSGIDWLGKIPKHWEVKRVKDIASIIKGKNLDYRDEPFEKSKPLLSLAFLRNDNPDFISYCYTNEKNLHVNIGDIVIIWDGAGVGEFLRGKEGILSSTTAKLVVNNSVMLKEFFFLFRYSIEYKLKKLPTGMGIPHLNPHLLFNFICSVPPISEQRQIADYLEQQTNKIDTIVSTINKQITKLQTLRKSLINEVVTGERAIL